MNRNDTQTYQMLTRVADFGTKNVSSFPKTSGAARLLDGLENGLKTMSEAGGIYVAAKTAMRNGRTAKEACRENLKSYLSRAAQLSRVLHTDKLQLPANATDQFLIDCGKGFLLEAESMKKDFVEHGLSAKFAEEVTAAIEDFEKTILDYGEARGRRSASYKKWQETLEETLDILGRFDFLVTNAFENDSAALASYAVARSIRRVGGRKAVGTTPPAAEPAPAPAAPTAVASVPAPLAATAAAA